MNNFLPVIRKDDLDMEQLWHHLGYEIPNVTLAFEMHRNLDVVNGWAYPVLSRTSPIVAGSNFGWSNDHIEQVCQKPFFATIDQLPCLPRSNTRHDVVLSFPGAYTYGHWFIDIAPRIELVLSYFDKADLSFIVPGPLPVWSRAFLKAYDIADESLIQLSEGQRYNSQSLVLPSLSRNSDFLSDFPHKVAFKKLRDAGLKRLKSNFSSNNRILIRHCPQTSVGHRATLTNFEELQTALEPLGFKTLSPLDMTHDEQIIEFASASIIVGENSSALHNIIYSERANLIVINGNDQRNLLHLSISKLLEHHCQYLFCDTVNDVGFRCNVTEVCDIINSIIEM